ncbi:4'-phosphopantetheinyl transferase family protein [Cellulomonas aerilata]|uniref:4'-phosphopantetheinyl transferase domain-containing protein n=1 Tax=Cellulomonas aerilata TaxID=515326 RepID=A0A512DC71_9CELL|nr:4'-phosphopantetheinyl transferase superfamily protein [Cellulomonas aerilata]GEO34056.1 hypothetical protein CAE01nite_17810 [Cellulomonas aerilata]
MAALTPGATVVLDVWSLSPRDVPVTHADRLLDDVERGRAAALPGPAAVRFTLGRALLRSVLAERLGCAPGQVRLRVSCPACGGGHGPVTVTGPAAAGDAAPTHVSVTRSGPLVAVAVCSHGPVGIDAVSPAAVGAAPLADVALSPVELARHRRRWPQAVATRALARAWVRKEAALKALGTGLSVAPGTLELHRARRAARGVDAVAGDAVAVADLRLGRGTAGAVAVLAPDLLPGAAPASGGRPGTLVVRRYDGARLLVG